MALFLGGGRPLLAGIMTLVMVDPLTSSDTQGEAQGSSLIRQEKLMFDTPEDQRYTREEAEDRAWNRVWHSMDTEADVWYTNISSTWSTLT